MSSINHKKNKQAITTDFYEKILFTKNKEIERNDENLYFLTKFIPDDKNTRILDAGCGNGKYASYLLKLGYHNLIAIDLFDTIPFKEVPYLKASIEAIPCNDNEFDFIYCNSVIYHLTKPEKGLSEFRRVLKPGGILLFTGHTKYSLHTLWRRLKLSLNCKSVENLKNATLYSTKKYISLLKNYRFKIIHLDGFGIGLFLYPYYRRKIKWFENQFGIKLPLIKPFVSKVRIIGRIKASFLYHFVIACQKENIENINR